MEFDIEQAAGAGGLLPLARLTLRHVDPSNDDIAFDPILHIDPDVQLVPHWLSGFSSRGLSAQPGRQRCHMTAHPLDSCFLSVGFGAEFLQQRACRFLDE